MNRTALFVVVVLLAARPAGAVDVGALLPDAAPGSAAHRIGAPAEYDAATLSNFIDGGAEVYLDYGFVRAATADYGSGDDAVTCTVYEMKDPQAAFGVFSYFRGERKAAVGGLGDAAFGADLQVAFWQDRYFTTVETFAMDPRGRETLTAFARAIAAQIGSHAAIPAIFDRLPDGRADGSERLLRGRLASNALYTAWPSAALTFDGRDVLLAARYRIDSAEATIWIVPFADRASLDTVWTTAASHLRPDAGCAEGNGQSDEVVCARDGRVAVARRVGTALAIVSGAASVQDASALIGRVKP